MAEFPAIVFYGTPLFAVASLEALVAAGHRVAAVVTAPDRPAGRGLRPRPSPVKEAAQRHGLTVLQPENLKSGEFIGQLHSLKPDLQIVIAFRMLPQQVWSVPPLGTFNLHASLLPDYRGAAPIHRAVMNGETVTGLTTFLLNDHIDTGHILLYREISIGSTETTGELHDRMMARGPGLVLETVAGLVAGTLRPVPQDQLAAGKAILHTAPKIRREDCLINPALDTVTMFNFIRGLSPFPGAYTMLTDPDGRSHIFKIFRVVPHQERIQAPSGRIVFITGRGLAITTSDGYLLIEEAQAEGRRKMTGAEFWRGYASSFPEIEHIQVFK